MAITNYSITAAGLLSFGGFSSQNAGGHNTRLFSVGGTIGFDFVGTACEVQIYQQGPFSVTIDGVASTITPSGSASFAWVTVASGLSDANHSIVIRVNNYIDSDAAVRVTGASPALSQSGNLSTQIKYNDSQTPDYIRFDGYAFNGNGAGLNCKQGNSGFEVTFRARISSISAFMYGLGPNHPLRLSIDGVDQSSTVYPPNSVWNLQPLWAGLDSSAVHTYSIRGIGASYFYSLVLGGGTGLSTSQILPTRTQAAWIGDSITAGYGTTNPQFDVTQYFTGMVGRTLDWGVATAAVSGQTMVANGLSQVNALISAPIAAPSHLFVQFGHNDLGSYTTAQFKTAYKAVIAAAVAAWPSCKIYCEKIFYDTSGSTYGAAYGPYNTVTQEAVTEAANANVIYADTSAWYNGVSGVHPSTADSTSQIAPAIAAYLGYAADTTAPTVTAAAINSTGTTLTLTFSEAVTGVSASDFALSGGATLSAISGSGTTRTLTISPAVYAGQTRTLSYSGTSVVDAATTPNAMLTFSGAAVTNSSTIDGTAPAAPVLSGTAGENQNALSAIAPADSDTAGIKFYRDAALISTQSCAPSATVTYTDTGRTFGTPYAYTAKAFDNAATPNLSLASNTVTLTPVDLTAPSVPANLDAAPADGLCVLTWSAATGTPSGYRLRRNGTAINVGNVLTYTDTGRANGAQLSYTVAAYDSSNNESAQSSAVIATPFAAIPTVQQIATAVRANLDENPITIGNFADDARDYLAADTEAVANVSSKIDTLQTTATGVKAKTDNLPASPASSGNVTSARDAVIAALPPAPDNAGITTLLSRLSLTNIASAVWDAGTRTLSAFGFTVNTNPNATELATLAKLQDAAPGEEPVVPIPALSNPSLCYVHGALRPARGGTAANVDVEFELVYDGPLKSGEILVERQFTLQTDAAGALSVVVDRNNSLTPSGSHWAITCEAAKIPRTLCNLTTGSFDIGSLIVES